VIKDSLTTRPQVFAAAVKWAAKFVAAKPVVPIQAGIMLDVATGTLAVSSFSENVSTRATLAVDGGATGRAVVSGRLLAELVATFPDKPITIEGDGDDLVMSAGRFHVTLPTLDESNYPELPATPATIGTVGGEAFAAMVARVAPAASHDLTQRVALAGVHLTFGNGAVRAIASDSYRAAAGEAAFTGPATTTALTLAHTLVDAAAAFIGPDDITIGLDDSNLSLTSPTRSLTLRLLGEKYDPEFIDKLFAVDHPSVVHVGVSDLAQPLKRAALVRAKDGPIRFDVGTDLITLGAKADDSKQASGEEIDAEYDGPSHALAFNPKYLGEALATVPGETVHIAFNPAKLAQVVFTSPADPTWRHILVPIRINS
jgi:DNA polymerase III subunit beta